MVKFFSGLAIHILHTCKFYGKCVLIGKTKTTCTWLLYVTYKRIKTLCVFSFVDEITRDFVPNMGDPETRKAKLIPWVPADMTDVDYFQKEPDVSFFQVSGSGFSLL